MPRSSLHDFLRWQHSGGEYDSEGEFTLDSRQAIAKMGLYQLDAPGLWLVKFVQAGVALGVTDIEITTTENFALLKFFGGSPVDGREIGRAVMSGELPSESWKLHLVVGLRALMACHPPQLCFVDSSGRTTNIGAAVDTAAPVSAGPGTGFAFYVELPPAQGIRRWLSRDPFVLTQVRSLCQLCHLPIRLNGETISRRFPPDQARQSGRLSKPRAVIALKPQGSTTLPVALSGWGELEPQLCLVPKPRLEPYRLGGLAILREGLVTRSSSWCYWVKDGAILRPRQLDFQAQTRTFSRFSLDLYLDGSEVGVDLSGFQTTPTAVDFLSLGAQLRKEFQTLDFTLLGRVQPGWTVKEQAAENRRSVLEALTWLKFSS